MSFYKSYIPNIPLTVKDRLKKKTLMHLGIEQEINESWYLHIWDYMIIPNEYHIIK